MEHIWHVASGLRIIAYLDNFQCFFKAVLQNVANVLISNIYSWSILNINTLYLICVWLDK